MRTLRHRAALYVDAARSMHPRQLAARSRRLLPPSLLAAGCARSRPAGWRPLSADFSPDPAPQSGPTPPPHEAGRFVAFGHERQFGTPGFWEAGADGLLFCFHLHGFAPLADYASGPRTESGDRFWQGVIEDWRDQCSRPRGPGWHPYPTSERVIAWTRALSTGESWPDRLREWLASEIWRQGRYLLRSVEHDIGGNHVLRNALAICHAGAVYPESNLLGRGLALLRREVGSQFLGDGAHQERSTSYHRRLTGELIDLRAILLADASTPAPWLDRVIAAAEGWQESIAGPDGRLPMLNDAWDGPPLPLASSRRPAIQHLADSGHVVLRHARDQLLIDVGPISPRHLPPHAHADALSFNLWIDGDPVIVDRGAFTYSGSRRNEFRGTAAHNTVEVDGADQCEFWGDFRAAFHPRVVTAEPLRIGDAGIVSAAHDGYLRLDDPVLHRRTFVWVPGDGIVIVDLLECEDDHHVSSSLHAAPSIEPLGCGGVGPLEIKMLAADGPPSLHREAHAPYLGVTCDAQRLEDRRRIQPRTPFGWSLLRPGSTVTELSHDAIEVSRSDDQLLRIPLAWEAPA